jgi:FtsZ-binding cell division protein ZapB
MHEVIKKAQEQSKNLIEYSLKLEVEVKELEKDNDRLRQENYTVSIQNERLRVIASQLGMCRRDTEKGRQIHSDNWTELGSILHPGFNDRKR